MAHSTLVRWRQRAPLPRFTVNEDERKRLETYFASGNPGIGILRPGGHIVLASNAFLAQLVFHIHREIRLQSSRSGDPAGADLTVGVEPKNANRNFRYLHHARGQYSLGGSFANRCLVA